MMDLTILLPFKRDDIRLDPASIATMAESTLSFLILVYFISLKGKTRDTWLMIGYIGINLVVYLVDIGVTSFKPPIYIYFRVSHVILLSILTLYWTWCAYTYLGTPVYREAIGIILLEGIWLGKMIVNLLQQDLTKIKFSETLSLYYVILGLHIWTIIVLFRRSVIASRIQKNSTGPNQSNPLDLINRSAQALRALALLFACWLTFIIISVQFGSSLSYHGGQMILLLGVLILHLNYAQEVTTFQVKLVSLPLASTLTLLGIIPFLLYSTVPPEFTWHITDVRVQQQLKVFVWLIPGATVFILLAFVLFYRVGLLKPLGRLLWGVHRIEQGDLDITLPVHSQDELGYFAQSLNQMALSLKASQEELENRVAARTTELQASLVRLRTTQNQLIQSEKMASLGELTAGIAHEIQNPLNFVNNFSEVSTELVEELKKGPLQKVPFSEKQYAEELVSDLTENLKKINQHGKRADNIVKNMLQHSRANSGVKELTNLNALAEEYLRLAYLGMRAKNKDFSANLITNFDTSLKGIKVVPQELGRVLLNLFNNAFYATQLKKSQLKGNYEPEIKVTTCQQVGQVEIRVRDNGIGIPENVKNKIFQPFFTTKPTGQGTGLGLSLSYDIITKGHSGEIKVEGKDGEYSEFMIILPE